MPHEGGRVQLQAQEADRWFRVSTLTWSVVIEVLPEDPEKHYEFVDEVTGGRIPRNSLHRV